MKPDRAQPSLSLRSCYFWKLIKATAVVITATDNGPQG
jgi:hypothetical protein